MMMNHVLNSSNLFTSFSDHGNVPLVIAVFIRFTYVLPHIFSQIHFAPSPSQFCSIPPECPFQLVHNSSFHSLLSDIDIHVLPVLNPDGYVHTWTKDRKGPKIDHPSNFIGIEFA